MDQREDVDGERKTNVTETNLTSALIDARALIEDFDNWTTGRPEKYNDNGAACYCLGGAVAKAITGNPNHMYEVVYIGSEMHSEVVADKLAEFRELRDAFYLLVESIIAEGYLSKGVWDRSEPTAQMYVTSEVYGFNDRLNKGDSEEALREQHARVLKVLDRAIVESYPQEG